MSLRILRALLLLPLLALMLPGAAAARQGEQQDPMQELQQIYARLQPLQEQALADEALSQQRDATTATLRAGMVEADPGIEEGLDRLEAMLEEVRHAQAEGDAQRLIALNEEAQEIQPRIARAQAAALAMDHVRQSIDAFQASLRARMIELEPDAERLLQRADELEEGLAGGY
jgi:hypothetical protein